MQKIRTVLGVTGFLMLFASASFADERITLRVTSCDSTDIECLGKVARLCDEDLGNSRTKLSSLSSQHPDLNLNFRIRRELLTESKRQCEGQTCWNVDVQSCVLVFDGRSENARIKKISWNQRGREDVCNPLISGYQNNPWILALVSEQYLAKSRWDRPSRCSGYYILIERQ